MSYPYMKNPKISSAKNAKQKEAERIQEELGLIYTSPKPIEPKCLRNIENMRLGTWVKSVHNTDLSIYRDIKTSETSQTLISSEQLSTHITKNLSKAGVHKDHTIMVSRYLAGALLIQMPLFLLGNTADKVAEVISISTYGTTPQYIFVPTGFSDIGALIKTIKDCEAKVIVLRNSTDFVDETFFAQLSESVPDKQLLFSVTIRETATLFSPSIYSYAGIVDCEWIWMYLTKPLLDAGIYPNISLKEYNQKSYAEFLKLTTKLSESLELSKGYCIKRALLLTNLFDNNEVQLNPASIYMHAFPLLHELYVISNLLGKTKEFIDSLQNLQDKYPYNLMKNIVGKRIEQ